MGETQIGHEAGTVFEQFQKASPDDFVRLIEARKGVLEQIERQVVTAVQEETLSPIEGAKLMAANAAACFGYDELRAAAWSPTARLGVPSLAGRN